MREVVSNTTGQRNMTRGHAQSEARRLGMAPSGRPRPVTHSGRWSPARQPSLAPPTRLASAAIRGTRSRPLPYAQDGRALALEYCRRITELRKRESPSLGWITAHRGVPSFSPVHSRALAASLSSVQVPEAVRFSCDLAIPTVHGKPNELILVTLQGSRAPQPKVE